MLKTTMCIENWYCQPIHCPFCGTALEPSNGTSCKHLLYIIHGGNFVVRTERFDFAFNKNYGETEGWPEFWIPDKKRIGNPYEIANQIRVANFHSSVEFDIVDPGGNSFICFAPMEAELCLFGRDHQSPYSKDSGV